jgi:hypothetical protein
MEIAVDLHAKLTHLLQPGNDPHQAMRIAVCAINGTPRNMKMMSKTLA